MNVSLTPQLEELVRQKVASGRYTSSSEVIREALRVLEHRDREQEEKLAALRNAVQEGLDGPFSPFDESGLERIKKAGRKQLAGAHTSKR